MERIIALLPMKGNSDRIPNKNLKDFHGKPLFYKVTESLLNSKYIDKVVINSDSEKIKSLALKGFGEKVIIIDRPSTIQGDFISMNSIIEYDLSVFGENVHFLQTHSTNPLLKSTTIDSAIEKYFKLISENSCDSLFSVTKFKTRFYWKTGVPINHDPNDLIRTQDLPIMYEENSNFFIFSRDSFFSNGRKRIGINPFLFEMNKIESIDIDEPEDFAIAKMFYRYLCENDI